MAVSFSPWAVTYAMAVSFSPWGVTYAMALSFSPWGVTYAMAVSFSPWGVTYAMAMSFSPWGVTYAMAMSFSPWGVTYAMAMSFSPCRHYVCNGNVIFSSKPIWWWCVEFCRPPVWGSVFGVCPLPHQPWSRKGRQLLLLLGRRKRGAALQGSVHSL